MFLTLTIFASSAFARLSATDQSITSLVFRYMEDPEDGDVSNDVEVDMTQLAFDYWTPSCDNPSS